MSPTATLEHCRAIGVRVWADGQRLRFQSSAPLPDSLLADLRSHKAELLVLLAANDETDFEAVSDYHDARRAVLQFDCGLSADQAKAEAWTLTQARYGLPDTCRPLLQGI